MEKMNDNEMEKVVGGLSIGRAKAIELDKFFPKTKIKCADCGKEIEVIDDTKVAWGMSAEESMRHNYYHNRCKECSIKKPYWRDAVIDGKIVRNAGGFNNIKKEDNNKGFFQV